MQRFRKSRRLMSVILTLLMLLSVCPLGAFADGEFTPDCKISLNNDGITVSEGFSLKTITTPANLIINCQVKGRPEEFLDATVGSTYLLTLPLSASYQAYSNTGGLIGAYQNHPLGGGKGHFAATTDPSKSHFGTHMVNNGKVNTKNDNYIVTKETLKDVASSDWYAGFVGSANKYGIASGVGNGLFNPGGTITRQEAATMVANAAALCGLDTKMEDFAARDLLAQFGDYVIEPKTCVTRAEIAQMLFNMLTVANLI